MEKNLTVYPIASGDILNVFANDDFEDVCIMDMEGNVLQSARHSKGSRIQVDIKNLENATYIVEVVYTNQKTARSVFVKL